MTPVLLALGVAQANLNGSPVCNAREYKEPAGAVETGEIPTLSCTQTECTLESATDFKGFLLGVEGGFAEYDNRAKHVLGNDDCVTHKDKSSKNRVRVKLVPSTTIRTVRAVVVYNKNANVHSFRAVDAQVPIQAPPEQTPIVIVGGGPGGLGAARYLESLNRKYELYERGPAIPESFWSTPLSENAEKYRTFYPLGDGTNIQLGQGLGGTQNVNGAVFAPGTPEDLAASLEVPQTQAKQAQDLAASWVVRDTDVIKDPESTNVAMMWAPIKPLDADRKTLHSLNTKMARRSIAYNFEPKVGTVYYNSTVSDVTDTTFKVNGTTREHAGIILAAGALVSPQLLGSEKFEVTNHGFTMEGLRGAPLPDPEKYTFEYTDDYSVETMTASVDFGYYGDSPSPSGVTSGLAIKMVMTVPYKQKVVVGQNLLLAEGQGTDPWHYMNSVEHTGMRVTGYANVYIGDASALKKPFNCHTSMPAAAAGVLAAKASLGADLAPPKETRAPYTQRARLFLSGLWILALGITAHISGSVYYKRTNSFLKALGFVHYVCQPTGTAIITAAAAWAALDEAPSAASAEHRILGWIVIGLLWANVLGGIYLKVDTKANGKPHRITGYVITALLMALAFTATVAGTGIDRIANAAAFAAILGTMLLLTFTPEKKLV